VFFEFISVFLYHLLLGIAWVDGNMKKLEF